jgi:DNA (cytosine-5)-methyltransferase 1
VNSWRFLSLCSGIEAASVAWSPLGATCAGAAEIDPFACRVLATRWPETPNLGDVTLITRSDIEQLGPLDVVAFGSPCQDLSIAGDQKGLAGERSCLFHDCIRVAGYANARFVLWENVPNALGTHGGDDFGAVVGSLAGCGPASAPENGWGSEGVALGLWGLVEWAVLDAQWFGLAQRRRRLFALLDTGDWANRPPILVEPQSLRGHCPPGRPQAGTDAPVAFALRGREGGSVPEVHGAGDTVGALRAASGGSSRDYIATAEGLRRLTPLECERLMGLPDSYTAPGADGDRYRVISNSMPIPVMAWIGSRIASALNQERPL